MKVENYQNKIIAWANELEGTPLTSGKTDCGSLCKQGLKIIYGEDIIENSWTTEKEAQKEYVRLGEIDEYLLSHGWGKIEKNYIQVGDLVVIETSPMKTFSLVVIGEEIIIVDMKDGVSLRKIRDVKEKILIYRRTN